MYRTQTIAFINNLQSEWNGYKVMIDNVCEQGLYCDVTILEPVNAPQGLGYQLGASVKVDFKNLSLDLRSKQS